MAVTTKTAKMLTDDLGQEFSLDFKDVTFASHTKGGQIMLPESMSISEGIWWMKLKQRDEETMVAVNERIEGYPIDVAWSLQLAVAELFGIRELRSTPDFFGETPPTFMSVPINARGDMAEVFIGRFSVPGAEGYLETARDWNDALWIKGKLKQKALPVLRALMACTRKHLKEHSLYKGKAFRVYMAEETQGFETKVTMANPEFIDTTKMPAELMLNQDTTDLLEAALWTPVERTEQTRFLGISLKRTVLLQGPYGTGKSLCALKTAGKAQENAWTFIYLKDVKDLKRIYPFAARYAPSVIFAEDIDLVVRSSQGLNDDGINMLNNVLDGVDSKGAEIILVLTTNHVDQIPPSMLRPGRIDTMVEFFLPDRDTAAKLVLQYGGADIDLTDFDSEVVGNIIQGNQPATIHEMVKRAKLYSQVRYPANYRGSLKLNTRAIVLSSKSMQGHLSLLNKKPVKNPTPAEQFGTVVADYIVQGVNRASSGNGHPHALTSMPGQHEKAGQPVEYNRLQD